MQDPFANKSDKSFHREVQMWTTVLMCLLVAFLYLAVKRMVGTEEEIPSHILRAGVVHVTPPIDQSSGVPLSLNRSQLPSAPLVSSGAFSNNTFAGNNKSDPILNAKPKPVRRAFGYRESSNEFRGTAMKLTQVKEFDPGSEVPIAQPNLVAASQVESTKVVDAAANEKAETIGRQRAKQLAAMSSGLPKRLNQIQSSIKRATAELPLEGAITVSSPLASLDNAFVPTKLAAHVIPVPNRTPVRIESEASPEQASPEQASPEQMPVKSIPFRPIPRTTDLVEAVPHQPSPVQNSAQPVAEKTDANNYFSALKPLRSNPAAGAPSDIKIPPRPIEAEAPVLKEYFAQSGDSFFTIAQQHYGDARWFRALRLANQAAVANADELRAGMPLVIPTTEQLAEQFPAYAVSTATQQPAEVDRRTYVTQAGDTLFDIARRKTGQGSRFSEIIDANQFRLPAQIRASDSLPAGVHLVLPESKLQ